MSNFYQNTQEEHKISLTVYRVLKQHLDRSVNRFPLPCNMQAVFFLDLLKLLTGSILRKRELDLGIVIKSSWLEKRLKRWPYLGYADLKGDPRVEDKKYGHNFSARTISNKMRGVSVLSQITRRHLFGTKVNMGFGGSSIDKELILPALKKRFSISWAIPDSWYPAIPMQQQQFQLLRELLEELAEKVSLPYSIELYMEIIRKHISNSVADRDLFPLKKSINYLICGSGCDIYNRLLAASAMQNGIKVINVMHGDSFGALDHPSFGYGEQLLCDSILGYGAHFLNNLKDYQYSWVSKRSYIPSSSSTIKKIYHNPEPRRAKLSDGPIYYCPTSLRGNAHRYGPYQDMSDFYYLELQRKIVKLFNGKIVVKAHPKDHYFELFRMYHQNFLSENLLGLLNNVNIFVFDYLSTAFCIAAATTRPIIYFDFGIQNITDRALETIRKRCIYYQFTKDFDISPEEIENELATKETYNDFSTNFSLDEALQGRSVAICNHIINEG